MDRTGIELTVVVLCRDNPSELMQTLHSLEHAGLPQRSEVLVVDGSADESCGAVLEIWRWAIPNSWSVRQIQLPPRGIYHALNQAIVCSEGAWLAFMNSGDSYLPGGAALLMAAAREHSNALRAVMGQALVCCPATGVSWLTPDSAMRHPQRWLRQMVPCHQAMVFERSFARSQPYPESAGAYGDRYVMRAALGDSAAFVYVKQPVCCHILDGVSSAPLHRADVQSLWRSKALLPPERVVLVLKMLLAPFWRWRPYWMRARSRLMGLLC